MRRSLPAVSRETEVPEPPDPARTLFGDRLATMQEYAELLATEGVLRGLIGPREVPRLWERHLVNCAVVAELIPPGAEVDDVGSGAGLPGIVLAAHRPDIQVTLVEPLLRRTVFLEEAVAGLGLPNVVVVRQRAEERALTRPSRDVVTARAVAPLARLVGWCMPLLKPGGVLLALKGSTAADELRATQDLLRKLGVVGEVLSVGSGVADPPTTVIRVSRDPVSAAHQRRTRNGRSRS